MGLIVDTSILIDAERRLLNVDQMLAHLSSYDSYPFAVSVISLMELAHGHIRAQSDTAREIRKQFLADLRAAVPAIAVTDEIAIRAGHVDAALRITGNTIGSADEIIAATALDSNYAIATFNVRHFKAMPGLEVVEL